MAASAGPGAPVRQVEVLDIEREHSAELAALFQQVGRAAWQHPSRRPGRGAQIRVACWRWLGQDDEAYTNLQHALELFAELGDTVGQADAHTMLDRAGLSIKTAWKKRSGTTSRPSPCPVPPVTAAARQEPSTTSAGLRPCSATTTRP
jgi:hypothetical protein